jgi:hypothetical protein
MLDTIKQLFVLIRPFIAPKLIGWGLKVLAGVFLTLGIQNDVATTWISGTVDIIVAAASFGLGALISLIQNKKAVLTTPPATPATQ